MTVGPVLVVLAIACCFRCTVAASVPMSLCLSSASVEYVLLRISYWHNSPALKLTLCWIHRDYFELERSSNDENGTQCTLKVMPGRIIEYYFIDRIKYNPAMLKIKSVVAYRYALEGNPDDEFEFPQPLDFTDSFATTVNHENRLNAAQARNPFNVGSEQSISHQSLHAKQPLHQERRACNQQECYQQPINQEQRAQLQPTEFQSQYISRQSKESNLRCVKKPNVERHRL